MKNLICLNDLLCALSLGLKRAGWENEFYTGNPTKINEIARAFGVEGCYVPQNAVTESRELPRDANAIFCALDVLKCSEGNIDLSDGGSTQTIHVALECAKKFQIPYAVFFLPQMALSTNKGADMMGFLDKVRGAGYAVNFRLYDEADFGSPSHRATVVVFCQRRGENPVEENTDGSVPLMNSPWLTKTVNEAFAGVEFPPPQNDLNCKSFPEAYTAPVAKIPQGGNLLSLQPDDATKIQPRGDLLQKHGKRFLRVNPRETCPAFTATPYICTGGLIHFSESRPFTTEELQVLRGFPAAGLGNIFGTYLAITKELWKAPSPFIVAEAARHIERLVNRKPVPDSPARNDDVGHGVRIKVILTQWKAEKRRRYPKVLGSNKKRKIQ